jgi:hypothetical protein
MEKEVKPITPNEIVDNLENTIPSVVIQAVNNLLTKEYKGDRVVILQDEIISEIIRLDNSFTSRQIFDNKMLDFEELYRKNGWSVEYDKPGYNENYKANFIFKKK